MIQVMIQIQMQLVQIQLIYLTPFKTYTINSENFNFVRAKLELFNHILSLILTIPSHNLVKKP